MGPDLVFEKPKKVLLLGVVRLGNLDELCRLDGEWGSLSLSVLLWTKDTRLFFVLGCRHTPPVFLRRRGASDFVLLQSYTFWKPTQDLDEPFLHIEIEGLFADDSLFDAMEFRRRPQATAAPGFI